MEPAPEVSVVIPCFNAATTIGLQLEALRRQIGAPQFEVIIVDNASQDDLQGAIERFRAVPEYSLRVVDAIEYQGSSYARNVGIGRSRADVVMCCDADDAVSRTWLRNGHRSTQSVDLWSGESILLNESIFGMGIDAVLDTFDAEPPHWAPPADKQQTLFPVLMGGNFGARRSTLLDIGGFDQAFAHFGDDNDLAFRARRAGFSIPVAETVRIAYRGRTAIRLRMRTVFRASKARRQLLEYYDTTPIPKIHPWPIDIGRCLIATILSPARRGRVRQTDLLLRWAAVLGNAYGVLRYRHFGHPPASRLGLGFPQER